MKKLVLAGMVAVSVLVGNVSAKDWYIFMITGNSDMPTSECMLNNTANPALHKEEIKLIKKGVYFLQMKDFDYPFMVAESKKLCEDAKESYLQMKLKEN